jgi:hypothetical protein
MKAMHMVAAAAFIAPKAHAWVCDNKNISKPLKIMVSPAGFEPATY